MRRLTALRKVNLFLLCDKKIAFNFRSIFIVVFVRQKTEQNPHPGELVQVFVGDSLLKKVLNEKTPRDPTQRVDWFIGPGARLKDLEELLKHVMHYYHSINVDKKQLNIIVGVGYNDHRDYNSGINELESFVEKTGYRMAVIPPPVPREQRIKLEKTDYGTLVKKNSRLVDCIQKINERFDVISNFNPYNTSVKNRSKGHFASDSYHFADDKCDHIINHIRQLFSEKRVFKL